MNLGELLANRTHPPDLEEARRWWIAAANAGQTDAQMFLGTLYAKRLDPLDLDGARYWYEKAAEAGHGLALLNLAMLLADRLEYPGLDAAKGLAFKASKGGGLDEGYRTNDLLIAVLRPELEEIRRWFVAATETQSNLGALLALFLAPELQAARGLLTEAPEAVYLDERSSTLGALP